MGQTPRAVRPAPPQGPISKDRLRKAPHPWSVAGSEPLGVDVHIPRDLNEEVGEPCVFQACASGDDVAAMVEPAPGKQDGEISPMMRTGVPEVAAKQQCGVVE
jgi:hypothetical protein